MLQAVGRTPNGKKIAAEKVGVAVTARGFINVDIQIRTNVPHMAVHEAHVAAEVIAGELQGIKVKMGLFPWTASGRAIAKGRNEGVTKLLFDGSPEAHGHGKILGGGMVGTPKPYVCQVFRRYLECGICANGLARVRFDDCGHDNFIGFSCKGRGVCPSCNTRRMVKGHYWLTRKRLLAGVGFPLR